MVKLWGSMRDVVRGSEGFKGYLKQKLYGITILNSFRMTEKAMYEYVHKINNIKPCLILAYASSIGEFIRFIQEHNVSIYSPKAVMTSASVLYPEIRAKTEKVFRTTVFNRYGSREVGDVACSCEKNLGLHLIPDVHYVEIVDDKGRKVKPL